LAVIPTQVGEEARSPNQEPCDVTGEEEVKQAKRPCRRGFKEFLTRASEIRQKHRGSARDKDPTQ
jgi:hypothetical protein